MPQAPVPCGMGRGAGAGARAGWAPLQTMRRCCCRCLPPSKQAPAPSGAAAACRPVGRQPASLARLADPRHGLLGAQQEEQDHQGEEEGGQRQVQHQGLQEEEDCGGRRASEGAGGRAAGGWQ